MPIKEAPPSRRGFLFGAAAAVVAITLGNALATPAEALILHGAASGGVSSTPINTVAPSIDYATTNHVSTARNGTWSSPGLLVFTYRWTVNGSTVGAANPAYTVTGSSGTLVCIITATDLSTGLSTTVASNSLSIGAGAWTSVANVAALNAIIAAGPTTPTNYLLASGSFGTINAFNKDFRSAPIRVSGQLDFSTTAVAFETNCSGITWENIKCSGPGGVTPTVILDDQSYPMVNTYNNIIIDTGTPFGTQGADGWVIYCPTQAGGDVVINGQGDTSKPDIWGVGEGFIINGTQVGGGRLRINNITIDNVEDNGIIGVGAQNTTVNAVYVSGVYATGGDHPDGIQFATNMSNGTSSTNITITNCGVQRGNGAGATAQGYFVEDVVNYIAQTNWHYDDQHATSFSNARGSVAYLLSNFGQGFDTLPNTGQMVTRGGAVNTTANDNTVAIIENYSVDGVNPGYVPVVLPGTNTVITPVGAYGNYSQLDPWLAFHPTARRRA